MAKHYGITDEDLSHDVLELLKPYQETYVDVLQTRVHLYHKSGDTRTSNLGVLSISSIRTKELEVNSCDQPLCCKPQQQADCPTVTGE